MTSREEEERFGREQKIKVGANSSEVAFFSYWFNLINLCLLGLDVTTNTENADDQNICVVDAEEPGTSTADPKKANKIEVDRVNNLGISTVD